MSHILTVLVLAALLTVAHELAHWCAALALSVDVHRFSIGTGPVLWSRSWPGSTTVFTIHLFPFSGYVAFDSPSATRKLLVLLAGPLGNLLLAMLLGVIGAWTNNSDPLQAVASLWSGIRRVDPWSVAASMSWAYGLLNLLPLAGLDGGQCLNLILRKLLRPKQVCHKGNN